MNVKQCPFLFTSYVNKQNRQCWAPEKSSSITQEIITQSRSHGEIGPYLFENEEETVITLTRDTRNFSYRTTWTLPYSFSKITPGPYKITWLNGVHFFSCGITTQANNCLTTNAELKTSIEKEIDAISSPFNGNCLKKLISFYFPILCNLFSFVRNKLCDNYIFQIFPFPWLIL